MYNILNLGLYPSLRAAVDLEPMDHGYHTRGANLIRGPFPRVDATKVNFKYNFVKVWNEIPANLKEAPSVASFKEMLREHFLSMY